jgi:serine/threonine-protein kinase
MRSARTVDARADIWSLGAIMFELLAGNPPFGGETVIEACTAILNDELPNLSVLRPDVPPQLEAIIRRCLEKERNDRYQSIGDLATDLASFSPASRVHAERALRVLGGSGSRSSGQMPISLPGVSTPSGSNPIAASVPTPSNQAFIVSPAGTPPPVAGTPHTSASWEATGSGSKTRRWPIVVMVGAVLAVIAAVGYREFSPGPASGPPPEVPSAVTPVEVAAPPKPIPPEASPTIDPPAVSAVPSVAPAESSSPASPAKPRPGPRPARRPDGGKAAPKGDGVSDFGGRR